MTKYFLVIVFFLQGCATIIASGYSYYDKGYFYESPWIEKKGTKYYLKWVYGEYGFFFQPGCISESEQAFCSLKATSSSGALIGIEGHIEISNAGVIDAIEKNRIYWLGPNNEKVKLSLK